MEIDWPKVLEIFGSGIIGVFLVMILLQIQTQLSTRLINFIETRNEVANAESEQKSKNSANENKG